MNESGLYLYRATIQLVHVSDNAPLQGSRMHHAKCVCLMVQQIMLEKRCPGDLKSHQWQIAARMRQFNINRRIILKKSIFLGILIHAGQGVPKHQKEMKSGSIATATLQKVSFVHVDTRCEVLSNLNYIQGSRHISTPLA